MTPIYFIVETDYQFLVALSLINSLFPDHSIDVKRSGDNETMDINFIMIGDSMINIERLKGLSNVRVIEHKSRGFYFDAFMSGRFCNQFLGAPSDSKLYFFRNREPISNRLSKIFAHKGGAAMVEEGLSLYRDRALMKRGVFLKCLLKSIFISIITRCVFSDFFGQSYYASEIYLRYPELYSKTNPKNDRNILKLPDISPKTMKRSLLSVAWDSYDSPLSLGRNNSYAIFMGQPLSELGIVNDFDELSVIRKLEQLLNSIGIHLLIKPHPRDSVAKYEGLNSQLVNKSIPAEIMMFEDNIKYVISFYSTSALNLSVNVDVKTYLIYPLVGLDINLPDLNNINIVKSFHDLLDDLKKIES